MTFPYAFDGDGTVNDWGFPEVSTSGSITLNSYGTASSPVIITISGYAVNPRIEHRQTGAVLALDYTIPVGETVVLNSETREVLINGKIPSQQIVSSRQWFTAGPGENTFMFSADSASNEAASTVADMNLASQNIEEKLTNPTFVNGFDGWSSKWRMTIGPQIDHWGKSRNVPVFDSAVALDGNVWLQGNQVPVNPGSVYRLSVWSKCTNGETGRNLTLQLTWKDSDGNPHWSWVNDTKLDAAYDWKESTGTVAIPPDAVSASLWLHVNSVKDTRVQVLVDSCSLKDITDVEAASFLAAYPVGSIYHTSRSVNPGDVNGGTWRSLPSQVGYLWERLS